MLPRRYAFPLLALLIFALLGEMTLLFWQEHQPKENPYDADIVSISRENGVDPFLVRALIWRESRFNPKTLGTAQEHGLMQVTPMVGQEWAKAHKITDYKDDDLYDPATNIRAGTWYLSHALRHWSQTDDPVPFALAEYNAGRSHALQWVDPANPQDHSAFMERITFPTTRKYVEDIITQRENYRVGLAKNPFYRDFTSGNMTLTP